jgi:hypothetical protein
MAAMTPDTLFALANPLALLGWVTLTLAPLAPRWADRIAGLAIPAILSVGYAAVVLAHWSSGTGGFDTLANVQALFTSPWIALAGWVHYLAFDLFVGAWQVRTARATGIPHLLVLPCLALTFLFGPAGLLAFLSLRAVMALRATPA